MHTKGEKAFKIMRALNGADLKGDMATLTMPYAMLNEARNTFDEVSPIIDAAEGMTTEEAVRYLKHGREMARILDDLCWGAQDLWEAKALLKKMEAE